MAGAGCQCATDPLTRIVVRISREALQGEGLHAMLQGICACIVAELPVAIASVILINEENTHFIKEVYAGEVTLSPLALADNWPISGGGAGRCARTGQAQLIADVDVDPDYVAGNTYVRSEYLLPMPSSRSTKPADICLAMPHPDSPVSAYVTISIGVSAMVPNAMQPPEALLAMADRALYSAKLQGRNCVQRCVPGG